MDTWTLQTGYPVVKVSRHPNSDVIRLEQVRFVYTNFTLHIARPRNMTTISNMPIVSSNDQ